jgi:hypothetical protein
MPAAFEQQLERARNTAGAFAEDALSAWCEAVGIEAAAALRTFADAESEAEDRVTLAFKKRPPRTTAGGTAAPGQTGPRDAISLANYVSDDDCPYHRFYPAAWPVATGASARWRWLVTSGGGGFDGLRVALRIEGNASARVQKLSVVALPLYNGQITSMNAVAAFEAVAPEGFGHESGRRRSRLPRSRFRVSSRRAASRSSSSSASRSAIRPRRRSRCIPRSQRWRPRRRCWSCGR